MTVIQVYATPYRCERCKRIHLVADGELVPDLCEQQSCNKIFRRWLNYQIALSSLVDSRHVNLAEKIKKAPGSIFHLNRPQLVRAGRRRKIAIEVKP